MGAFKYLTYSRTPSKAFFAFLAIILVTYFVYYDGILYSKFLLDDFPNLQRLSTVKSLYDLEGILGYSLNGIAGPTGRPLSLFTFALQESSWPNDPFYFKLVNFGIHIINGYLVYSILLLVFNFSTKGHDTRKSAALALAGSFIWLIHPIQTSTVLYAVQRMTELSALFVFTGLLIYLHGRELLIKNPDSNKGIVIISAAVIIGAFFGTLAKENAILLCLYIITFEITLFRKHGFKHKTLWSCLFLYIPLLTLLAYLIYRSFPYLLNDYPIRTFSAYERLITEFRVITEYISLIIIPRPNQFGLFHTDFLASTSFFNFPIILSFLFISSLLGAGIYFRKSLPKLSLGILFFFSAHALESTFVNLEIYFEHRNYVAILGIIILLLFLTDHLFRNVELKKSIKTTLKIGGIVWIGFIAVITYKEVQLWSKPVLQAEVWYKFNPESDRARGHYNNLLTLFGQHQEALKNYKQLFFSDINDPGVPLLWMELRCFDSTIPYPPHQQTLDKLSNAIFTNAVIGTLDEIATLKEKQGCSALDNQILLEYIDAISTSKHYQRSGHQRILKIIESKYLFLENDIEEAIEALTFANKIKATPDILISISSLQHLLGNKEQFIISFDNLMDYCESNKIRCAEYKKEIKALKKTYADSL
jgi:tetratricopeptide (TPR) repeat protein